jgi:hypothetical protein
VRAGDGEVDTEIEIGGAVVSRQGPEHPRTDGPAPRRPRGGPRAPARGPAHRRRHGGPELRAPAGGRHGGPRAHARPAHRQDREAAGLSSAPRRSCACPTASWSPRRPRDRAAARGGPIVQKRLIALAGSDGPAR